MKKIFLLSLVLFGLLSCNNSKTIAKNIVNDKTNNDKSENTVANNTNTKNNKTTENSKSSDSLLVSIRHPGCFGKCPIFTFTIYQSGYAIYHGVNFVDKVGDFATVFPPNVLVDIKRMVAKIHYFEFKDQYVDRRIQDIPSTFTSVQLNGVKKTIEASTNVPPTLQRFQLYLDGLVKTVKWEKIVVVKK